MDEHDKSNDVYIFVQIKRRLLLLFVTDVLFFICIWYAKSLKTLSNVNTFE
jgi:hypothetical protein